jgi:hypothetical protein
MKLNYADIDWKMPGIKAQRVPNGLTSDWLVCVIDGEIVKSLIFDSFFSETLLTATSFKEVVTTDGSFCVKITSKDNQITELTCNEMLHAVLLSEPLIIKIDPSIHKHYQILGEGWLYVDGDFVIPGEMD